MTACDDYIDDVVSSLNTTKRKRQEIADQFRDHLDLLMEEYWEKGMDEREAEQAAIERFGTRSSVRRRMNEELDYYRTLPNIVLGLLIGTGIVALYLFVGKRTAGTGIAGVFLSWTAAFLCLSPIGYFLPIVFRSLKRIGVVAGITALCSIVLEAAMIVLNWKAYPEVGLFPDAAPLFFQILGAGLIGCINGLAGFGFLRTVNRFMPSRV